MKGFPLALTLSLEEREQPWMTCEISCGDRPFSRRTMILPLPGEKAGVREVELQVSPNC